MNWMQLRAPYLHIHSRQGLPIESDEWSLLFAPQMIQAFDIIAGDDNVRDMVLLRSLCPVVPYVVSCHFTCDKTQDIGETAQ